MRCSYCEQDAKFECGCARPYMCSTHLGLHLIGKSGHPINELSTKLNKFKSNLLIKLQKLSEIKIGIFSASESLIKQIESLSRQAIEKISPIERSFIEILRSQEPNRLKMQENVEIEPSEMFFKPIHVENIRHNLVNLYSQNFTACIELPEIRKNRFLKWHGQDISDAVISKDHKIMVTLGEENRLRVWDLVQKKPLFVLSNYKDIIGYVKITENSEFVITGTEEKLIIFWDLNTRKQVAKLRGHQSDIKEVVFISERSLVLSRDYDTIYIWNFFKRCIATTIKHKSKIYSMILKKNSNNLILGSKGKIIYYDIATGKIIRKSKGPGKNLIITTDEKKLVSTTSDKYNIILTDESTLFNMLNISTYDQVKKIAISSDNQYIISQFKEKIITWSIITGDKIKEFPLEQVSSLPLKENNLLTFSSEKILITEFHKSIDTTEIPYILINYEQDSVSFSNNNKFIAYICEGNAYVWDSDNERKRNLFKPRDGSSIQFIRVSNDGKIAITVESDLNDIMCWNLNTGQKIGELVGHENKIECVEIFNGSLNVASGSKDNTVRVWDLTSFSEVCKFIGHNDGIISIKFIENKNLLVSLSDEQLLIWNLIGFSKYSEIDIDFKFYGSDKKFVVTDDGEYIFFFDNFKAVFIIKVSEKAIIKVFDAEYDGEGLQKNEEFDEDIFYLLTKFGIPISLSNQ